MSVDINILEKKILDNKPITGDKANQYNFGQISEGESLTLMGKSRSNRVNLRMYFFFNNGSALSLPSLVQMRLISVCNHAAICNNARACFTLIH